MNPFITAAVGLLALAALIWIGLKIRPRAFTPFPGAPAAAGSFPLPAGLPAPVERFYRVTYGDSIPVIHTAVLSGRGSMAPFGIPLPMRFRFIYEVGKDYRSIIDATFFNRSIMHVNETYIGGRGRGELPFGIDEGEWFDRAMNLRIACEILNWFPAALLSDPRVRWQPIDEDTVLLVISAGHNEEHIIVRFNPQSGKMTHFEAMKGRSANETVLWINAVWFDQGKSWIVLNVEERLFNVGVAAAIREPQ